MKKAEMRAQLDAEYLRNFEIQEAEYRDEAHAQWLDSESKHSALDAEYEGHRDPVYWYKHHTLIDEFWAARDALNAKRGARRMALYEDYQARLAQLDDE